MGNLSDCLFVTGTDTGVGKTRVASRLLETLNGDGGLGRAVGFKPVLSGPDRRDAEDLWEASGQPAELTIDAINPVWLQLPVAPIAGTLAGEEAAGQIDRDQLIKTFESLVSRFDRVIIEGAGGWEVPFSETETFAQLAVGFGAPVLVVAANRLGVLNHTRLTVDAVRRAGLACVGVILNEIAPPDPDDVARRTNLEILRRTLPDLPIEPMAWNARDHFSTEALARLGIGKA